MSDIDQVNEVIQDARRALDQMLWGHHDRAAYFDELGVALGDKFSITRDADDFQESIRVSREAVNITPTDFPDRAGRLNKDEIRLTERHSMTEEISDIRCAIDIKRQVLDITPNDDPDRAVCMNNLGTALADQYAQTGRMADLDGSSEITQQAINPAVKDDMDLPMSVIALRFVLWINMPGQEKDLASTLHSVPYETAINLMPSDFNDWDLYLNSLVIQSGHQYARAGEMDCLYDSIRVVQDIVDTTPFNDPDRPTYLNSLGLSLRELYSVKYQDPYIENAILTPEYSKTRASYFSHFITQG